MNTPEFKRLMQIGIIVRNVEEAAANYEAIGIGPWEISVMDNSVPPFDDLKIDGQEPAEKGPIIKTAMITIYGLELELIEPIADTNYKRWLDEHGPGIHHVAFDTETPYEQLLAGWKEKNGKEPWVRGEAIHGVMDFSYLDLREELGLIVECYKNLQPGKPAIPYDMKGEIVL